MEEKGGVLRQIKVSMFWVSGSLKRCQKREKKDVKQSKNKRR